MNLEKLKNNKTMEIFNTVNFYKEKSTALLNIDKKMVDLASKRDEAKKYGLFEKDEFHITIIGNDTGKEILQLIEKIQEQNLKDKIFYEIQQLCSSYGWDITLKQKFYYIEKSYELDSNEYPHKKTEVRKSIIQIAEIKDLNDFYKNLNSLLKTQFEIPFPHVTLYTTSTLEEKKLRGIGLYSKKQFNSLNPKEI